ncbi:MAG: TerC family protein [Proteobacteria bacterium]|jgi:YjbE family integral membrane protein|nr:TerC family protein [Pseudomonadota bacterium]NCU46879.1 TerC family protein [Candidatus Fonsibacter lacus]NCU70138.1 TerC family protein [Candidatus Fonsibacter lacus]NDB49126.1 TerC family protein [Pseudomonadota bacterium]NDC43811.1 TerC family protein [Pseudomonadota bacterium]
MEFFSEEIRITIQIILIDLVLSADNAVIIGMAASQFDPAIRKKVLIIGTGLAVVFRILFSAMTAYLMQFQGIRTVGGILLFWVAYKLYVDILKDKKDETKDLSKYQVQEAEKSNFRKALMTVIVADITLSLDNVIAVAGAAKTNYTLLVFGLALAIILMVTLANAISVYLKKHKWIGWLGFLSVLWVAADLIWDDIQLLL